MSVYETATIRTLMRDVRDSMRMRGFTERVSGEDLLLLSPRGETVVLQSALQDDDQTYVRPVGLLAQWVRGDVTITQNESDGIRVLRNVLSAAGPNGRAIAEASAQEALVTFIEHDGHRRRVILPSPLGETAGDVEAFFAAIRVARIRQAATEYGLPMEYAEAMFEEGGAA
jgi:hypothetical protein